MILKNFIEISLFGFKFYLYTNFSDQIQTKISKILIIFT